MSVEGITMDGLKLDIQREIQQQRAGGGVNKLEFGNIGGGMKVGKSNAVNAPSFSDVLKAGVEGVNKFDKNYQEVALGALKGERGINDVMMAQADLKMAFTFMVETKNELVKGLNEIMRMNV